MAIEEQILFSLPLSKMEPIFKSWIRDVVSISTTNSTRRDSAADELLTIDKAAEMLSVSVPTVYGYVHHRQIPCMKRRGRLYFSKSELLTWVQSGRRATTEEIKRKALESLES